MVVYLVRHGTASAGADGEKHLTEESRRGMAKVAALLRPLGLSVSAVRHSGKARARETAEILAGAFDVKGEVAERPGLAPGDPVEPVKEELDRGSESLMLVGHLPFMGALASLLAAGDASAGVVAFHAGEVVCLARQQDGTWMIYWAVSPDLFA